MPKFCKYCGHQIDNDANFCCKCGNSVSQTEETVEPTEQESPIEQETVNESNRNKIMLFLGGVGVSIVVLFAIILCNSHHQESTTYSSFDIDATVDTLVADSVETGGTTAETHEEEKSPEDIAEEKIVGTYHFDCGGLEKWTITFNDDGTCTMYEAETSEYLWHGSWVYHDWERPCYTIDWSSCDNPYLHTPFTSHYNYIDGDVKYIYGDRSALDAKDSNGREKLRKG